MYGMEFFSNLWVIGIGVAVIAGLILYFVFGIGKPKRNHPSDNPKVNIQQNIQSNAQVTQPSVIVGSGNSNLVIQQNIQQNPHEISPTTSSETSKSNISPREIFKYLDSIPPFQRDSIAKNYKDIKVKWDVQFSNYFSSGGIHYLMLTYQGSIFSDILCQVDLVKYPEFRVIQKDQKLVVEGIIDSVDNKVNLKNCSFTF
jgi:hypothetical protein